MAFFTKQTRCRMPPKKLRRGQSSLAKFGVLTRRPSLFDITNQDCQRNFTKEFSESHLGNYLVAAISDPTVVFKACTAGNGERIHRPGDSQVDICRCVQGVLPQNLDHGTRYGIN